MSYKIDCKISKIFHSEPDSVDVLINPVSKFLVQRKNPNEGNKATDYALFVRHEFFSGVNERCDAVLMKLDEQRLKLKLKLNKESFDYMAICAAQAAKGLVRLLVDDDVVYIESIEMV